MKYALVNGEPGERFVAPYTGAWIEISLSVNAAAGAFGGRPLYGGVD